MAYITKRGNSYSVRYTYEDEHGKSCDKWESFPTKEEATNRKKQIEHELAAGTLQFQPMQRIPTKKPTVQKPCIDRASPEFSGLHNKKRTPNLTILRSKFGAPRALISELFSAFTASPKATVSVPSL
jgi:hypothetical protein